MGKRLLENLKEQYAYETWQGRKRLDEQLFVRNVFVAEETLPAWQPQRIQEVPLPRAVLKGIPIRTISGEMPRFIQSIWTRPDEDGRVLLKLEAYECASHAAAHEFLLQMLGEFQLPAVIRKEDSEVGDIVFSSPGDTVQVFARGNMVYVVSSVGREVEPVADVARQVDTDLIRKPRSVPGREAPTIRRFASEIANVEVHKEVRLKLDASHPSEQPIMYKFFSRSGEVRMQKGQLVYVPRSTGEQNIEVYAVAPNRGSRKRSIKLTAT